ncbi:MAG: MFS transporter [Kordiimonadaceae bacterium]|nr:MFS transporter [Kordiimonadaceae bacterium]MBT6031772.1 MFS transporter [Kordiimonadaceae bacterium]MBT6329591.1 MFS transporter [Kordiimonadaceae bacterium]MBT7581688.1 MFS transporter [Kordiimonadaceae bacterium]
MINKASSTSGNENDAYDAFQDMLQNKILNSPMKPVQLMAIIMCFVLNMIDGMDVLIVSFTSSSLEVEWGLSKTQLGYIFGAGLFGMMMGCICLAPIADRIGRFKLLFISTALIASGMLATAIINSLEQMLVLRFITGLGIGSILPTMAAVASEFSNEKNRNFSVGFVQGGWSIGAILTGFFVAWAVPQFGWRIVYATAGSISLIMLPLIYWFMPETLSFLAKHQPENALKKINGLLKRMGQEQIDHLPKKPIEARARTPVRDLFSNNLKRATLLLWSGIFFAFMTLYTLISWIPNIATTSGMPFELATYAGMALNVGAFIGTVGIGWLATWLKINRLIFIYMLCGFIFMSIYANFDMSYGVMFGLIFFIGISAQGGITGFYPAAARAYSSHIRTTGIGWAIGIGRFGAIIGPALFGILYDAGIAIQTMFIIFSFPLLLAGIAALLIPQENLE